MAKEILGTDVNGRVDYSLPPPVKTKNLPLAENVVSSVTTPANFNRAFFSFGIGTNVWVTYDGVNPVVPSEATDVVEELNPAVRQLNINGGETLKFISDSASYVSIRYDLGS